MKKLLSVSIIIFVLCIFSACVPDSLGNNSKESEAKEAFNTAKLQIEKMITNNMEITSDIVLETQIAGLDLLEINWESSDSSVISATGQINRLNEDVIVTITAHLVYGSYSDILVYNIKVLGNHEIDEIKLDENTIRNNSISIEEAIKTSSEEVLSVYGIIADIISKTSFVLYYENHYLVVIDNDLEIGIKESVIVTGRFISYSHFALLSSPLSIIEAVEIYAYPTINNISITDIYNTKWDSIVLYVEISGYVNKNQIYSEDNNYSVMKLPMGIYKQDIKYTLVGFIIYDKDAANWSLTGSSYKIIEEAICPVC